MPENICTNYWASHCQVIQGDHKLCKRLHNFIVKKVIATQQLNGHHCKEQLNFFLHAYVRFAFNFCVAIMFLPMKLRDRSHYL
jgi:hypothetical protein